MMEEGFETFEHGADIGIRGYSSTVEGSFCQCLRAMSSQMIDGEMPQGMRWDVRIEVELYAQDLTSLLLKWLNSLLAEGDIHGAVFWECHITISLQEEPLCLRGEVYGTSLGFLERGVEVKGATYTEAGVFLHQGRWVAQCVIDM